MAGHYPHPQSTIHYPRHAAGPTETKRQEWGEGGYNPPLMDRLWAPWRMTYIKSHKDSTPCFICAALRSKRDDRNLVVARGRSCVAMLNRYPYATGHLM